MFFLVYVSSAINPFSERELTELLEISRRNNLETGITGMLLYKDGNFMQFLEGAKEDVIATTEKVRKDPRHRGMIVLLQQEQEKREFSDWAMGFKKLDANDMSEVPGYSDFLDLPLTSEQFQSSPPKSLRLLMNFKKIMR